MNDWSRKADEIGEVIERLTGSTHHICRELGDSVSMTKDAWVMVVVGLQRIRNHCKGIASAFESNGKEAMR